MLFTLKVPFWLFFLTFLGLGTATMLLMKEDKDHEKTKQELFDYHVKVPHIEASHDTLTTWNRRAKAIRFAYGCHEIEALVYAVVASKFPPPWQKYIAVQRQESGLYFEQHGPSSAGALSIMQMMPSTQKKEAKIMGMRYSSKTHDQDIQSMIMGYHHLNRLHETWGDSLFRAYVSGKKWKTVGKKSKKKQNKYNEQVNLHCKLLQTAEAGILNLNMEE